MAFETIMIGTVVVMALFAIAYFLGYREDKQQRDYLRTLVSRSLASEQQDAQPDEPTRDHGTTRRQEDCNGARHEAEAVRTGSGKNEPMRVARNSSG
jgi:hypothetical protein